MGAPALPAIGRPSLVHLQIRYVHLLADGADSAVCTCGSGDNVQSCIHRQLLQAEWAFFSALEGSSTADNPEAAVVNFDDSPYSALLSVRKAQNPSSTDGRRTFVWWLGGNSWRCEACTPSTASPATPCIHRQRAKHFLLQVLDDHDIAQLEADGGAIAEGAEDAEEGDVNAAAGRVPRQPETNSRSFRAVPPPTFARLDPAAPRSPVIALTDLPSPLPINEHSRCACRRAGSPDRPVRTIPCTVYSSSGAIRTQIQVKHCSCARFARRWSVGPDLGEYGLFNYSNSTVVTHELLNACSSQFLRSPTPLSAFHHTTEDAYLERQSPVEFMSKRLFVRVFFSFVRLQSHEASFICPKCGEEPATVIADGVSISFPATQRLSTLQPPTIPTGSDEDRRMAAILAAFLEQLPQLSINNITTHLYIRFLRQLATADMLLSIVRRTPTLSRRLGHAHQHPTTPVTTVQAFSLARCWPALGALALYYAEGHQPLPRPLVHFASLLYLRAKALFTSLKANRPAPPITLDIREDLEAQLPEGTVYGLPTLRQRPLYPRFKEAGPALDAADGAAEHADERTCRKYYSTYSERRQTGGLMVLWCRHSVCLGFHVLPRAEGRNDVFSVLLTRFKRAPRFVVYDFACALGPYCLKREAEFF
ncbi:hypothetical protein JCM10296v2_007590 [Rhodotorula toruloides]